MLEQVFLSSSLILDMKIVSTQELWLLGSKKNPLRKKRQILEACFFSPKLN